MNIYSGELYSGEVKYTLYLITDRTPYDVDRWKQLKNKGIQNMTATELAEWRNGMKGSYNYTDLNRVEEAVKYVAQRLTQKGYSIFLTTKTDWTLGTIPTKAAMDRYMGNVARIRSAIPVYPTTPAAPTTAQKLTYKMANDIEQILKDVDSLIDNMLGGYYFSGDLYAGEI